MCLHLGLIFVFHPQRSCCHILSNDRILVNATVDIFMSILAVSQFYLTVKSIYIYMYICIYYMVACMTGEAENQVVLE